MMRKLLLVLILPIWFSSCVSKYDQMGTQELQTYLTPPVGTPKSEVESYLGYPTLETPVNGQEENKSIGYMLFYPVYIEVIYEAGKVLESSLHHERNLADWSSEMQFDVAAAQHKKPIEGDKWLRKGYLHFIEGRNLLSGVSQPPWHQAQKSRSEQDVVE